MRSRRLHRAIAATLVVSVLAPVAVSAAAPPDKAACIGAYESVQTNRKDGKLREAHEQGLVCAQAGCPATIRDQCAQWIGEIEKSLPTVVVSATDDGSNDLVDVQVWVDDAKIADKLDGKAMPLNPGPHKVKFVFAGAEPVEQTLVMREGEKNRELKVRFATKPATPKEPKEPVEPVEPKEPKQPVEPKEPKEPVEPKEPKEPVPALPMERPTPTSVYVLGAAGLVGLGVFTAFGVMGMQNKTALDNRGCKPNCPQSDVDQIKQNFLIGDVGLALGVVSLGAATVLYFTRGEVQPERPKAGWTWQVAPTRTGAMGALQLTF